MIEILLIIDCILLLFLLLHMVITRGQLIRDLDKSIKCNKEFLERLKTKPDEK